MLSVIRNEFGRKISIEPNVHLMKDSLQLELKYQFREEVNALERLSIQIKHKTDQVQQSYQQFLDTQRRTDSVMTQLRPQDS